MTRRLTILALVTLVAAPLPADDNPRRAARPTADVEFSVVEAAQSRRNVAADSLTDDEEATPSANLRQKTLSPTSLLLDDEAAESAPETEANDAGSADCEPLFYPIYELNCTLAPIDDWCNCDAGCCTTDEWCDSVCDCSHGTCHIGDDCGEWLCSGDYTDVSGKSTYTNTAALRLGWWSLSSEGSKTKTGEYQALTSSPFYELDTLFTNGSRTLDMTLTGLDNEANNARAYYYGPNLTAKMRYQRYLRRLDHDPLFGFNLDSGTPATADNIVTRDLSAGDDYAMRIQQLDARFQGKISQNLKWKLNVWGMRKFGERQATAVAHCFNITAPNPGTNNKCHVESQSQSIDWLTMEIEPALEWKGESVSVEYRRTMRSFGQNDQLVGRDYTRFGYSPASGTLGPEYFYAYVPESFTYIDRLRISAALTETNDLYTNVYHGNTKNQFRDTHRDLSGADLRLINRSIEGVTTTAYATWDMQNNDKATTYLTSAPWGNAPGTGDGEPVSVEHPVDYQQFRYGIKSNWKPAIARGTFDPYNDPWSGLTMVSGYEYSMLERNYANYSSTTLGNFVQPDTKRHQFEIGPNMQWTAGMNTFVKYKARFYEDPIIGPRESTGRFNTNQPEQEHGVDIGGTWAPTDDFIATAQFGIVNRWNHSVYPAGTAPTVPIDFNETNYPVILTLWHAPTERLSLNMGYGYFSNWIDQDITIGWRNNPIETTRWAYGGENHVLSFGANYALRPNVQLIGGYEWNHGSNAFVVPPSPVTTPPTDWNLGNGLASYSDVLVETNRFTAGVDWQPYRDANIYLRYNYFDYNDLAANLDSGTAHMLLTGVTVVR